MSGALATSVGTGSTATTGAEGAVAVTGLAVGAVSAVRLAAAAGGGVLGALGSTASSGSTPVGVGGAVAWMGLVAAAAAAAAARSARCRCSSRGGESPELQTGWRGACSPMLGMWACGLVTLAQERRSQASWGHAAKVNRDWRPIAPKQGAMRSGQDLEQKPSAQHLFPKHA